MGDAWSWSDVASEAKPRTDIVPIILDGNLGQQLDEARAALKAVEREDTLDGTATDEAQAEIERIEALAENATKDFTVRSAGYAAWRKMVEDHPGEDGERWNAAAFVPAAVLACCDQFTTEAEVDDALGTPDRPGKLSTGQVLKLFAAIRLVNEGDDRLPFERRR